MFSEVQTLWNHKSQQQIELFSLYFLKQAEFSSFNATLVVINLLFFNCYVYFKAWNNVETMYSP
jgi:hypothetical protein